MSTEQSTALRIELPFRPGNAAINIILQMITLVLGDHDKELAYEEGGRILIIEDTPANIQLLTEVMKNRSWNDNRFDTNRNSPSLQMGICIFKGAAQWSKFLNQLLDTITSTSVIPA